MNRRLAEKIVKRLRDFNYPGKLDGTMYCTSAVDLVEDSLNQEQPVEIEKQGVIGVGLSGTESRKLTPEERAELNHKEEGVEQGQMLTVSLKKPTDIEPIGTIEDYLHGSWALYLPESQESYIGNIYDQATISNLQQQRDLAVELLRSYHTGCTTTPIINRTNELLNLLKESK